MKNDPLQNEFHKKNYCVSQLQSCLIWFPVAWYSFRIRHLTEIQQNGRKCWVDFSFFLLSSFQSTQFLSIDCEDFSLGYVMICMNGCSWLFADFSWWYSTATGLKNQLWIRKSFWNRINFLNAGKDIFQMELDWCLRSVDLEGFLSCEWDFFKREIRWGSFGTVFACKCSSHSQF